MNDDHDDRARSPLAPNIHLASELEPAPITWLWPLRIPLGHLTILVGDPGVGKSLLAADLAARVSVGLPWPDARQPALAAWQPPDPARPAPRDADPAADPIRHNLGGVLIVSHEDSRRAGILPRLLAAGADLTRVAIVNGVYREPPRRTDLPAAMRFVPREPNAAPDSPLILPDHLPVLQRAIRSVDAPRLVILDTLHSLLAPGAHASPDAINTLLTGLAETAALYHVAIVAIHHLTKTTAPRTLYRVRGAIPFVAAARAAFLVSSDPATPHRRFLSTLKSIYAPDAPPIAFEIVPRLLDPTSYFERPVNGRPPTPEVVEMRRRYENPFRVPIPAIRWSDPREPLAAAFPDADSEPLPEELLADCPASRSALLDARHWLADYLAQGPKPAAPLIRDARAHGHPLRTLRRVKRILGIVSRRLGNDEPWVWYFPQSIPTNAPDSDNQECQPTTREKGTLAPFGQNAENPTLIGTIENEPSVHDSAREQV